MTAAEWNDLRRNGCTLYLIRCFGDDWPFSEFLLMFPFWSLKPRSCLVSISCSSLMSDQSSSSSSLTSFVTAVRVTDGWACWGLEVRTGLGLLALMGDLLLGGSSSSSSSSSELNGGVLNNTEHRMYDSSDKRSNHSNPYLLVTVLPAALLLGVDVLGWTVLVLGAGCGVLGCLMLDVTWLALEGRLLDRWWLCITARGQKPFHLKPTSGSEPKAV